MEPIPETFLAIDEYGPFTTNGDLVDRLRAMGEGVRGYVPECVGLSLAWRELGITFTVVATSEPIACLDGLQYLNSGPCTTAVEQERVVQCSRDDIVDEQAWQLFARGTAAAGVESTLTLPIMMDGRVVGSVNLYASSPDAFSHHVEQVAHAVGGWAPGAVANADLSFDTRRTAQHAPRLLGEEMATQIAVGILMEMWGLTAVDARTRLRDAAVRAGISEVALARTMAERVDAQSAPSDQPVDDAEE